MHQETEYTTIVVTYPNNARQLKRLITALLKKKLVKKIHRVNYTKTYTLDDDGGMMQNEEKIVWCCVFSEKKDVFYDLVRKMHPTEPDFYVL